MIKEWPPREVHQLLQVFDELTEVVIRQPSDRSIAEETALVHFYIIRASGLLEQCLNILIKEAIKRSNSHALLSYSLATHGRTFRGKNVNYERLVEVIQWLALPEIQDLFKEFVEKPTEIGELKKRKDDLRDLAKHRNEISHGESSVVGSRDARRYGQLVIELVDFFIRILNFPVNEASRYGRVS